MAALIVTVPEVRLAIKVRSTDRDGWPMAYVLSSLTFMSLGMLIRRY